MKRFCSILIVMPLALAVACGSSGPKNPPALTAPTPTATEPPSPVATSITYAAYAQPADIFIYDVTTDTVRRLTSDGNKTFERLPRFRTEGVVSYVVSTESGGSLMQISTDAGAKPSLIFRPKNMSIDAYDWSPDRSVIAYLTTNARSGGGSSVSTYRVADGTTAVLKRLPDVAGREFGDDDAITVAWSPDGSKILVLHTALETGTKEAPSMYVLNTDGSDAATPAFGTHGIWTRDSAAVIYRDLGGSHRWLRLSVSDGRQTQLAISGSAVRPALSLDGKTLAYDIRLADSPEGVPLAIGIFDIGAGTERRLISGFGSPVWLSTTALAASKIRACKTGSDECGDGPPWTIDGNAQRIAVSDGSTQELKLGNTIDSDVLYR